LCGIGSSAYSYSDCNSYTEFCFKSDSYAHGYSDTYCNAQSHTQAAPNSTLSPDAAVAGQ
jgi:hypothetical protein